MILDSEAATKQPLEILDNFILQLTGSTEHWSIGYQLQKAVNQFAITSHGYTELQSMLLSYLTSNGRIEVLNEDAVDWVAGGICLLEGQGSEIFPRIAEVSILV